MVLRVKMASFIFVPEIFVIVSVKTTFNPGQSEYYLTITYDYIFTRSKLSMSKRQSTSSPELGPNQPFEDS